MVYFIIRRFSCHDMDPIKKYLHRVCQNQARQARQAKQARQARRARRARQERQYRQAKQARREREEKQKQDDQHDRFNLMFCTLIGIMLGCILLLLSEVWHYHNIVRMIWVLWFNIVIFGGRLIYSELSATLTKAKLNARRLQNLRNLRNLQTSSDTSKTTTRYENLKRILAVPYVFIINIMIAITILPIKRFFKTIACLYRRTYWKAAWMLYPPRNDFNQADLIRARNRTTNVDPL